MMIGSNYVEAEVQEEVQEEVPEQVQAQEPVLGAVLAEALGEAMGKEEQGKDLAMEVHPVEDGSPSLLEEFMSLAVSNIRGQVLTRAIFWKYRAFWGIRQRTWCWPGERWCTFSSGDTDSTCRENHGWRISEAGMINIR